MALVARSHTHGVQMHPCCGRPRAFASSRSRGGAATLPVRSWRCLPACTPPQATAGRLDTTATSPGPQQPDAAAAAGQLPTAPPPPASYRGTAVVVGAGPAGATAALFLAEAGYRVHVLERRGHPGQQEADKKRTYLIGLGERGLSALDAVGLAVPPRVGRPMTSSVYCYKSGKRIDDPFTPDSRIVGVDRQGLSAFLVDEAIRRHPQAITFHWQAVPGAIDLAAHTLTVQQQEHAAASQPPASSDANNSSSSSSRQQPAGSLKYDLLVGADGAGSMVRAAMAEAVPGMTVTRLSSPVAELEYKAFHNLPWNDRITALLPPAAASGSAAADRPSGGMTFFAFNNPQPDKPSPGSITLYLNAAGTWSGTLYQPPGQFESMAGDVAAHETAIRQFTPESFPVHEWVPLMARQMADMSPSRINPMQLVSRLSAPDLGVVLLGDAGHNVTPQMGQGCNSALEDAKLLAEALSRSSFAVPAALAQYEQHRRPQVHALQRMEEENAWVRRPARPLQDPLDKTFARAAWISFFLLLPLLRLLPGMKRRLHASLFQNIMSTTVPYNRLHAAVGSSPLVLVALLTALAAGLRAALGLGSVLVQQLLAVRGA